MSRAPASLDAKRPIRRTAVRAPCSPWPGPLDEGRVSAAPLCELPATPGRPAGPGQRPKAFPVRLLPPRPATQRRRPGPAPPAARRPHGRLMDPTGYDLSRSAQRAAVELLAHLRDHLQPVGHVRPPGCDCDICRFVDEID